MLFPDRCGVCGSDGPSPCRGCAFRFRAAPRLDPLPPLAWLVALLAYEGGVRRLVGGLKYRAARTSIAWLSEGMAHLVVSARVDAVTWAPTSAERQRARGADQAELLARATARRAGVPALDLLERRRGPPQTGRTRAERLAGPEFVARRDLPPLRLAVIDDVVTTGATLRAAAEALRRAGAGEVGGIAAAATPPPSQMPRGAPDVRIRAGHDRTRRPTVGSRAYSGLWHACGSVVASRSQP